MSRKLENAWRAVFNMAEFINLPDPVKDRAVAKFFRHQRPDLFDMDFAGDGLLWYVGTLRPSNAPAMGLRMSDQLQAAVTELTSRMDATTTADPTWEAILALRAINESAFDLSIAGDSLAYFLAGLDMTAEAE